MTPQEIKHGSPRTSASAIPDVDEPTSKDLIDGDRVFALQALNKYQAQTKAWRDCGGQISPGSTGRIKDLTKGPRAQ